MSHHEVASDEIVGERYVLTCECGATYEDDATQQGSDHIWNQMRGHLLGSSNSVTESSEAISVYDAALIWASNGRDEDYMFGYSEHELEGAL